MNRELRIAAAEARFALDLRRIVDEAARAKPAMVEPGGFAHELAVAIAAYEAEHADRYTCPVCGRTSWHPVDKQERWCGACQGATGYPPPPGYRWVLFEGGELDDCGRLLGADNVEVGDTYTHVLSGQEYVYDGTRFRLEGPDGE